MVGIIYFIVIILANTIGAISGMGGGVLIKPIFDAIGVHSLVEISFYSTMAVFTMAIVSTWRQIRSGMSVIWQQALLISLGAVAGGVLGNVAFDSLLKQLSADHVQLIQIALMILTLLGSLMYTRSSQPSLNLQSFGYFILVGGILGFLASLLGIGGGPINVALLMFCFQLPLKEATIYSLVTILFSQLAKIITILSTTGVVQYDLNMLWYIIPAAIIGGTLGAKCSQKLSVKHVGQVYQLVIIFVLVPNLYNAFVLLTG